MKPHPKLRKTIKWCGAAVTVLLVVVWIANTRCRAFWQFAHGQGLVMISRGRVELEYFYAPGVWVPSTQIERPQAGLHFDWWFSRITAPNMWSVAVPLWAPAVLALLASGTAWRLDTLARRRAGLNHCPKCNYDRAGIATDARCPECGAAPASV